MDILFVSKFHQFRSKVAEGYFHKYNKIKDFHAHSAGVITGGGIDERVLAYARKAKVSLKTQQTGLTINLLEKHDLVIAVGDNIPASLFAKDNRHVKAFAKWDIACVDSSDEEAMSKVFLDIEEKVKKLLGELGHEQKKLDETQKILLDLQRMGNEDMRVAWEDFGIKNNYGVPYPDLIDYSKKLGKNHKLAHSLWKTNIHDARLLAALIEDPAEMTDHQAETWIRQADFWDITDKIATEILMHTDFGFRKIKPWVREKNENFRRSGWVLLERYAKDTDKYSDKNISPFISIIEKSFAKETECVQESMIHALIRIGKRSRDLHEKALDVATKIADIMDEKSLELHAPNPAIALSKVFFAE